VFFAYVAVENAAKEGALYGARNPLCADDTNVNCSTSGKSVQWYVENEAASALKTSAGASRLTTVVTCHAPDGTLRQPINDCVNGDTYEVRVSYGFQLLTPILSQFLGSSISIVAESQSPVIGDAFDPSGLEILVWVDSTSATNKIAVTAACQPADTATSPGYFYGPCQDQNNTDNYLIFPEGLNVTYKVRVRNTGNIDLTGVTYQFQENGTNIGNPCGSGLPNALVKGAAPVYCTFSRPTVASNVTVSPVSYGIGLNGTVSVAGLSSSTNGLAVVSVIPRPRLEVNVWASTYRLGDDGDGNAGVISYATGNLGIVRDQTSTDATIQTPVTWLYLRVANKGGQANSFNVNLTRNAANVSLSTCTIPISLATFGQTGDTFTCVIPVTFPTTANATFALLASATNSTLVAGTQQSVQVTVTDASACNPAGQKVIPNLVDTLTPTPDNTNQTVAQARARWNPSFTGAFTTVPGSAVDTAKVIRQPNNRAAYTCAQPTTAVTVDTQ